MYTWLYGEGNPRLICPSLPRLKKSGFANIFGMLLNEMQK